MTGVLALWRLGRPLFLGGGFVLFALGAMVAAVAGHPIDPLRYALGQGAVTAFQWMTHYANDYFDYDADRANKTPTRWSGGSRVLVNGELSRRVALIAALVLFAIGAGLSVLVVREERVALPILVAIAVLAWSYSAPPLRLCARGLGELTTAIVLTGLVPLLGFALQVPTFEGVWMLVLALAPLVVLQIAMLIAIEIPDAASDAATGKRTLVVRMGTERAAPIFIVLTTLAYVLLPIGSLLGLPTRVVIAATLPVPLAAWRLSKVADDPEAGPGELAGFSILVLMGTAIAEVVAFSTLLHG